MAGSGSAAALAGFHGAGSGWIGGNGWGNWWNRGGFGGWWNNGGSGGWWSNRGWGGWWNNGGWGGWGWGGWWPGWNWGWGWGGWWPGFGLGVGLGAALATLPWDYSYAPYYANSVYYDPCYTYGDGYCDNYGYAYPVSGVAIW